MKKLSVIFVLLLSIFFFTVPADAASSSQLIIINKKTNTLAFYNAGKFVRTFSVATGRSRDLTPEGKFRIVNKIVNRPYYTGNIPGGDPRNPLGNRWMGLEANGTYGTTYGIHGNANESSIGKYVSSGCVRMHNEEVRWLFDQVELYTTVIIAYSDSSFDAIAKANGISVNTDGWVKVSGDWYYYANGTVKTGWQSISGKWYYFNGSGVMKTGWQKDGNSWYYLDSSGAMKTGWLKDGSSWFYLSSSGAMKTGWLKDGSSWYYLDTYSGAMRTGWVADGTGWYYLNSNGTMKTGWLKDGSNWYYLASSGVMKTGWVKDGNNKYYLDDKSGIMRTGWLAQDGSWYYLNPYSGDMRTGWLKDGTSWYYLDANGKMVSNTMIDGYVIGADGIWVKVEYVALGDSLAAGLMPDGQTDNLGYPDYIAENFGKAYDIIDFDNFGVSGFTTGHVIEQLKDAGVQKEIKEATHLTIDIGANDLLPVIQKDPTQAPAAIGTISANLNTILTKIDELNPKVKVYVMGYYNPFPYLPQEQQAQLIPVLTAFNGQIQAQAVQHGDTFVATDAVIASNFQEYLPNPANIHLSLTGYKALAGEFWKVMK
ncbi:L,D-transpeptidase family protein [Bacillus salipaludis]|uniref:L,D-transpeptidase family protein n=1 Tax=Bacillus salipaludis TaxID=2547811 RepID=A0ABW8REG3_9BACI